MSDAPSIREALEEGFAEAAEATEAPPAVETAPEPVEAAPEPTEAPQKSESRARDESGKFTKKPVSASAEGVKTGTVKAVGAELPSLTPTALPVTPPAEPAAEAVKPPQSWRPAAREDWAKVPTSVQQEVDRRERETAVALQESAEARKHHSSFRDTVAPYEANIRSVGLDPMRAVQGLLQTDHTLRTGPPQQKAELIARMMTAYGVPVEALASALDGTGQPVQSQQQFHDPRVDQILAQQQQRDQAEQQAKLGRAQQTLADFQAKHEFFEDVREEMSFMLELSAKRGIAMTLDDAYNRATQFHPEISQVLKQRDAAKAATNANASTQRAMAAASSVRSTPAAQMNGAQPDGLRDQLREVVAGLSGR